MARKNRDYTPDGGGKPAESNESSNPIDSGIPGNNERDANLPIEDRGPVSPESATPAESAGRVTRSRPSNRTSGNSAASDKSRKSAANSQKTAADLSLMIASAHMMLAKLTGVAELDIDEDEAKKMGDAVNRVNELFEGSVLSPKAAALGNLAFVMGSVYVPRFIVIRNNRKKKSQPQLVAERKT